MPLFDYKCPRCLTVKEVMQKTSEAQKIFCPHCVDVPMEKIISGSPGFQLKGIGVYKNNTH